MKNIAKKYDVKFVCNAEDDYTWEVNFTAYNPIDVKNIISACSAYNSGDECECFINNEKAILESDWGLL